MNEHEIKSFRDMVSTMTPTQIARTARDWSKIAGEPVRVEQIESGIYAFGSELATLRLFRAMPSKRQGYSENMGEWYFCAEMIC